VFVPDKPFEPNLMFVGKARSLHFSGARERYLTRVCCNLTHNNKLDWKGLAETNTLPYYKHMQLRTWKFYDITMSKVQFFCLGGALGVSQLVYNNKNLFLRFYFRLQQWAPLINIRLGWKGLPGTSILAFYKRT